MLHIGVKVILTYFEAFLKLQSSRQEMKEEARDSDALLGEARVGAKEVRTTYDELVWVVLYLFGLEMTH